VHKCLCKRCGDHVFYFDRRCTSKLWSTQSSSSCTRHARVLECIQVRTCVHRFESKTATRVSQLPNQANTPIIHQSQMLNCCAAARCSAAMTTCSVILTAP
jgi:hypothetical protein